MDSFLKNNSKYQSQTTSVLINWLEYLSFEKKYSKNTLVAYQHDIEHFFSFIQNHTGEQLTENILQELKVNDFRSWLVNIGQVRGANSKNRALSVIRSFYKYCEKKQILKNEEVFLLRNSKSSKNLPRALNVEETKNSISEIENIEFEKSNSQAWVSLRDKALLTLIYSTGMRISEALNLKVDDIKADYVKIIGKGGKERIIPLLLQAKSLIDEYISECPFHKNKINKILFLGKRGKKLNPAIFQKNIRKMRQNLELPDGVTPHAYRHSYATHLLQNSGDLRTIQELLGHASLSTTQRYTKIEPSKILEAYNNIKG